MNWQRARTEENKSTKKEAIFNAAFLLFKRDGYEKVSFNNIAVTAGFAKSNKCKFLKMSTSN